MSDWLKVTRRRWLALVVGSLAAVSLPWPSVAASLDALRGRDRRRDSHRDLHCEKEAARWRSQLRSPESAAIVGSAYLAVFPSTATDLVDNLAASICRPSAGVSDAELRRRVRDRIRADYREERTIRLHSWTLSRTEAQLCALYARDEKTD